MKELSIEEKALAYDKAIERAKELKETCNSTAVVGWCDYIFPELEGIENELMRMEAIAIIKQYNIICEREGDKCYTADKVIAWLEKLGEKQDYDPYKATVKSIAAMVEKYTEESDLQDFYDNVKVKCKDAINYDKTWFKKSNEQKITNKVISKFRVGEWLTSDYSFLQNPVKIIDASDTAYMIENIEGDSVSFNLDYIDKHYHLWTVKDAKDGDILASKSSHRPFIFKGFTDKKFPNTAVAHCGIDASDKLLISEDNIRWTDREVTPATAFDRKLLFDAMHEKGYDWDAQNKSIINYLKK